MPIIKPATNADAARHAIALSFGDLRRDVSRVLDEARAEAAQIVADAQAERERLISDAEQVGLERGRQAGHAEGFAEGKRAGEAAALAERAAELHSLADAWNAALERFESEREGLLRDARADLLRLSIAIAERVLHRALDADEVAAVQQLDAALALAQSPTRLLVRAHPADVEQLRAALPNLVSRFADSPHTEVAEDAALTRGSCVVSTDRGEIDMRIEAQLARIAEALLPGRSPALAVADPVGHADPGAAPVEADRADGQDAQDENARDEDAGA